MNKKAVQNLLKIYPLHKIVATILAARIFISFVDSAHTFFMYRSLWLSKAGLIFSLAIPFIIYSISGLIAYYVYQNKRSGWIALFITKLVSLLPQFRHIAVIIQAGLPFAVRYFANLSVNVALLGIAINQLFLNRDPDRFAKVEQKIAIKNQKVQTILILSLYFVLIINSSFTIVRHFANYFNYGTTNIINIVTTMQLSTLSITLIALIGVYQKKLWGLYIAALISSYYLFYYFATSPVESALALINAVTYSVAATTSSVLILHHFFPKQNK